MHPADLGRELAKLVRLAEAARSKLDEVGEALETLRQSIVKGSAGRDPTTDSDIAQAEAASK